MKKKLILVAALLTLGGCQSMVISEDANGVVTKTPTSLLAVQSASANVTQCRVAVLQSQTASVSKLDTSTEAGRTQLMMMTMLQQDQLAQCDRIVAEVAAQFNQTDRSRLSLISKGVSVGGGVVGGYIIGNAVAGLASAGGTRINASNSNVTTFDGKIAVSGAGGLESTAPNINVGTAGSVNTVDSNHVSGSRSMASTSPADSTLGGSGRLNLNQNLILPESIE